MTERESAHPATSPSEQPLTNGMAAIALNTPTATAVSIGNGSVQEVSEPYVTDVSVSKLASNTPRTNLKKMKFKRLLRPKVVSLDRSTRYVDEFFAGEIFNVNVMIAKQFESVQHQWREP